MARRTPSRRKLDGQDPQARGQGGEGSAEIVRLQHGALHRIVRQRRKCHTFAARPIPSSHFASELRLVTQNQIFIYSPKTVRCIFRLRTHGILSFWKRFRARLGSRQ